MKKILSLVLALCLCVGLYACSDGKKADNAKQAENAEKITAHLESGEYKEAYDLCSDNDKKTQIIAENFLAVYCRDMNINTEVSLKLTKGWYGQVTASETDTYTDPDSVLAVENYADLAEYISTLSGSDVLGNYYYGLVEVVVDDSITAYGLSRVDIETDEFEPITIFFTLDPESGDSSADALYKYIARQLESKGTQISSEAVGRINDRYLQNDPADAEFEFDLS